MLGANIRIKPATLPNIRIFPKFSEMRAVVILSQHEGIAETVLRGPRDGLTGAAAAVECWDKLEEFRCLAPMKYELLEEVVGPSLKNGNLTVLELSVLIGDVGTHNSSRNSYPDDITPEVFKLGSEKLQVFGLRVTATNDLLGVAAPFKIQPALDMISRFPNVHTVAAYSNAFSQRGDFVRALLYHEGIKRIHQDGVAGVERDELMEIAKNRGIDIVHSIGIMPITFPRELDSRPESERVRP